MAKHHYLPQFYLKGFANQHGQFMIYSVKKSSFKMSGKFFNPASHFFLADDNTVIAGGTEDDSMEEHYSQIESQVARILEKIKAVDQGFGLNSDDVVLLNYFAGELFWRVPAQRQTVAKINNIQSLNQLGIAVIDRSTLLPIDAAKFDRKVADDPAYEIYQRKLLPLNTYLDLMDCTWPCTVKTFTQPFPAICGDNPVILRQPEKLDIFRDDLILPLAPNKVLFRIRDMKEKFWPGIKFYIDMLMLAQAEEFVCCTDQGYLQELKTAFEQEFGAVELLREAIFVHLTE